MSDAQHDDEISPVSEASPTPGERLRQAREARGLSVQDVATNLRLNIRVINALEQDEYDELPSATFVSGYLRAYARLIDLPEQELAVPRQASKEPPLVHATLRASQSSSRDLPVRLITVVILLGLLVSAVVWWVNEGGAQRFLAGVESTGEAEITRSQGLPALPALPSPQSVEPFAPQGEGEASEAAADSLGEEGAESAAEAAPAIVSQGPVVKRAGLELRFTADSWTEVTDNRGEKLVERLVKQGENLKLQGEAPFSVFLGYAAGVSVYFNDELFDHRPFQRRDLARFRVGGPEHNLPVSR